MRNKPESELTIITSSPSLNIGLISPGINAAAPSLAQVNWNRTLLTTSGAMNLDLS